VDKILSSLPLLISSSSVSSYQLIQLVALNLYAMLHCRRRLGSAAGSVTETGHADNNGPHQNGDAVGNILTENSAPSASSDLHAAYDKLVFTFTGSS